MTQVLSHPDNAAFAFWAALPFVAYFGYHSVSMRRTAVARTDGDLGSPFLVEMKCRFIIQDATEQDRQAAVATAHNVYRKGLEQVR